MVRKPLAEYLSREYPFTVTADPDGGYVIVFPDLPGCMTQVDTLDEVGPMAEDVRLGWLETAYEQGIDIPLPSYPEEYSGKFNLRLPRSLHRALVEAAAREGVSLNSYAAVVLARGDAQARVERRLAELEARLETDLGGIGARLEELHEGLRYDDGAHGLDSLAPSPR